jgi:transposase
MNAAMSRYEGRKLQQSNDALILKPVIRGGELESQLPDAVFKPGHRRVRPAMLPHMDRFSSTARRRALESAGLLHPQPDLVKAALFDGSRPFFLALDKVQVKYEMLRAHLVDGVPATTAAAAHGYSRAAFYLVVAHFEDRGMLGLLDERRGRRGPVKITPEILAFIREGAGSGAQLSEQVERQFGVQLHRRTIERIRRQ